MKPETIAQLRGRLGITQVQLAEMLLVDSMTVSRWERGVSFPSENEVKRMGDFDRAARKDKAVKATVATLIVIGAAVAVGYLLYMAYDDIKKAVSKAPVKG